MRTYQEVIGFLYSQLPIFQRVGQAAYKADLTNTIKLCKILDNPEKKFKSIHIAGTNGKGSCSHILASVFQEAGYKTGLYTSPHLKDFRERIRINGKKIPQQAVVNFVNLYKDKFIPIQASFFEITVGMAFEYFKNEKVDIAILETGLGGRLDSTNVITPELSVITNIGTDHTNFLGNTYEEIACEKAGIMKPKVPVVIGETQEETKDVFSKKTIDNNAAIYFADQLITLKNVSFAPKMGAMNMDVFHKDNLFLEHLETDLIGKYQLKNIVTCIQSILILRETYDIPDISIRNGLKKVKENTGFSGRWHIVKQNPLTIADTGHNKEGVHQVMQQINNIPHNHLHFVLGMVNDKNLDGILELLPKTATYYFCKANIPRGMPAEDLKEKANQFELSGEIHQSVKKALAVAQLNAENGDLVFIGGSTFTVAEIL